MRHDWPRWLTADPDDSVGDLVVLHETYAYVGEVRINFIIVPRLSSISCDVAMYAPGWLRIKRDAYILQVSQLTAWQPTFIVPVGTLLDSLAAPLANECRALLLMQDAAESRGLNITLPLQTRRIQDEELRVRADVAARAMLDRLLPLIDPSGFEG